MEQKRFEEQGETESGAGEEKGLGKCGPRNLVTFIVLKHFLPQT